MVNIFKIILLHVKEYCEQAAIHGPQHIVSPRLNVIERLVPSIIVTYYRDFLEFYSQLP